MPTSETIHRLFNELKSCSPADVSKHSVAVVESFLLLEKSEQKELAETFYKWTLEHSTGKPLLFCYAKLILAFSLFYSEQYDEAFPLLIETQNLFTQQNDPDGAALC